MKMKFKIVAFGNCQAFQLTRILSALTPEDKFIFQCYSNNDRTGGKKSTSEILDGIKHADILIYQPLSKVHGELSDENIKATITSSCVALSFPYIFNSGISSLCHNRKPKLPHGKEHIIDLIDKKYGTTEILDAYKEGKIDFKVQERFQVCLLEQKKREAQTSIKLTDFIAENYQKQKLFISHNHPTNALFYEMIRQIKNLTDIPIRGVSDESNVCDSLMRVNCPVSPYDVIAHNYQFEHDVDWFEKGALLIKRIVKTYM